MPQKPSHTSEFVNAEALADARIGFNTIFDGALESMRKVESFWKDRLALSVTSSNESEAHKWMGDVPAFEEWKGPRKIGSVRADTYRILNKDWANGIKVHKNDIADDKLGLYAPRISRLASKAVTHQINLLVSFLVNGFATTVYGAGYDGKAFFAADHSDGGGPAYSNTMTKTLDDTGAFDDAIQLLRSMVDENGEPWGVDLSNLALIVGPKMEATARGILTAQFGASGASNTNFGRAELLVASKLVGDYDDYWFLAEAGSGAKPLIFQMREGVTFRTDESELFSTGVVKYGADARYNVGYGFPQTIVGSVGTA
jgi:phage major head subunit gpT-like protein